LKSSGNKTASTASCKSILWDYYDSWCASCKRDEPCVITPTEARAIRFKLRKDSVTQTFSSSSYPLMTKQKEVKNKKT